MLKFAFKILLIFTLILNLVLAQAQVLKVHGSVQSATGKAALPGASVTLTRITFEDKAGTVTDGNGVFLFEDVTPGHYRVVIEYLRYKPVDRKVTIYQDALGLGKSLSLGKIELEEGISKNLDVQVWSGSR